MNLNIVSVTPANEQIFLNYVGNRLAEYFFFFLDYKQFPEHTHILMALDEANQIHGMALEWKQRILQLRGSEDVAKRLLEHITITPVEVTGLMEHAEILKKRFPNVKLGFEMIRMVVSKGKEIISINHPIFLLERTDIPEIVALMNLTDPIFWGSFTADNVTMDANHQWFGIKMEGKIVAIAGNWRDEEVGIISIVGTHPEYRCKGMATSVVGAALHNIFEHNKLALIHVRADNVPAVKVYTKAGYKPFLRYIVSKLDHSDPVA